MIKTPNYTQTPNELFDELMKILNDSELRVFLAIIRKTFGWNKKRDRISITQIEEITGLSRQGVLNGLYGKDKTSGLVGKKLVLVFETKKGNEYEVNVVDQTEDVCSQLGLPETVNVVDHKTGLYSQPCRHTKERDINKLSKEIYIEIETAYINAFKEVIPDGEPIIDYKKTRAREKTLLSKLGKDKIIQAITAAKKDSWIIEGGFSLMVILGDYQLNKLLNGRQQKPGYSKPLPVQTRTTFLDMED